MSDKKGPAGNHNWDLTIKYHCCPKCESIFESRGAYEYRLGDMIKELTCPRCDFFFRTKKNIDIKIGPFFGKEEPKEIDWET